MLSLMVKLSAITLPLMTLLSMSSNKHNNFSHMFNSLLARPLLIGHQHHWLKEYDYIIVGSGSAGAVLANRLSEDQHNTVMLLEAGGNENFISDIPIAYQLLQKTKLDWSYQTVAQKDACFGFEGRSSFWPRGRVLGGTSVLNVMLYTRGNPNDYNDWPQGWHWPQVYPYFLKSENNQDFDILTNGFHSHSGPLDVRRTPHVTPLGRAFIDSAHELGYAKLLDLNGPTQSGFAHPQTTNRAGARCSTAKAFLYPIYKKRPNLHILTFAMVTQILFNEHKRAIGVQFDRLKLSHALYARKEVILSAGAINSPQLLLLSGVGPKHDLKKLGIPLVADLPVGRNLQDHIYPGGVHFSIDKPVSLTQKRIFTLKNLAKYFTKGIGPLASTGVDGLAFVSTKYVHQSERTKHKDWPDIEMHMVPADVVADGGRYFKQLAGLTPKIWSYYRAYMKTASFSIDPVLLRPKSRGYLTLRSRNPYDHPLIDPRYLSDPRDVATIVEGMKLAISIGMSRAFTERFNSRLFQLPLPGCHHLSFLSDHYLECVARTLTWTIYHPVGTCKMVDGRSRDPTGVVDAQLRVMGGISGLRVVDASVMPNIVSANTNAPVIMIAERAADLIRFAGGSGGVSAKVTHLHDDDDDDYEENNWNADSADQMRQQQQYNGHYGDSNQQQQHLTQVEADFSPLSSSSSAQVLEGITGSSEEAYYQQQLELDQQLAVENNKLVNQTHTQNHYQPAAPLLPAPIQMGNLSFHVIGGEATTAAAAVAAVGGIENDAPPNYYHQYYYYSPAAAATW